MVLVATGLALVAAAPARADQDPPIGSVAWVEQQLEAARAYEIPEGIRVKYRVETHRLMTDAEMAETRRIVAEKPEDFVRFKLMGEEQRIQNGPDIREYDLLYADADHWRINKTTTSKGGDFADMAQNGTDAWQMTPDQAQLIDTAAAPPGYEPDSRQAGFTTSIRRFVLGPFYVACYREFDVLKAGISDDGVWSTMLRRSDGQIECEIRGIVRDNEAIITESRSFDISGRKRTPLPVQRYSGYGADSVLGARVYRTIEEIGSSGNLRTRKVLLRTEPVQQPVIQAALHPPKLGGDDAIRGAIQASQLVDLRSGQPVIHDLQPGGAVVTTAAGEAADQRGTRHLRQVGWVAGAVMIMAGAFLWWRRRQVA